MKTLAIRYWLVIALIIYFLATIAPFVFIGTYVCSTEKPAPQSAALEANISTNVARWADPIWQADLVKQLPEVASVVLLQNNQELFRAGKTPRDPTPPGYAQIVVMNGTQQVGVADLYDVSPCGGEIYGTVGVPASLIAQAVVGLGIAWVLNSYVLRPIMWRCARRKPTHLNT